MKHMRKNCLKDRTEPDVAGLDEEQAKEALKKDYEERREHHGCQPNPCIYCWPYDV